MGGLPLSLWGGAGYSGEPHVFVSADTRQKPAFGKKGKVLNLGHLDFDIVSDLELRISDFASLGIFTLVKSPLQINSFMQNKANFQKSQMNVSIFSQKAYENKSNWTLGENKPNTNPNKANLLDAQMNVNSLITKDYRKNDAFAVQKNKPNSNPISERPK